MRTTKSICKTRTIQNNNSENKHADSDIIDTYNTKLSEFIARIPTYYYIFEVIKSCGYSEFVTVLKEDTIQTIYRNIGILFDTEIEKLTLVHQNSYDSSSQELGQILVLPKNSTKSIKSFVIENSRFFIPIYPVGISVVYRLFYY